MMFLFLVGIWFTRDHIHPNPNRWAWHLLGKIWSVLADNYDRIAFSDLVPDAVIWICLVLLARCGSENNNNRSYLLSCHAFCNHPDVWFGSAVDGTFPSHDRAEYFGLITTVRHRFLEYIRRLACQCEGFCRRIVIILCAFCLFLVAVYSKSKNGNWKRWTMLSGLQIIEFEALGPAPLLPWCWLI